MRLLVVPPSPIPAAATTPGLADITPWIPATVWGGLITGIVALAALIVTIFQNRRANNQFLQTFANTHEQQVLNRDRQFRSQVYRDFLVQESARTDAYIAYSTLRKKRTHNPGKKEDPAEIARLEALEERIAEAGARINEARAATWTSLSAIQMLGTPALLRAARAYDKAVSAANPMRERQATVPLEFSSKRDLIFAYITEARRELRLDVMSKEDMFWSEQAELSEQPVDTDETNGN